MKIYFLNILTKAISKSSFLSHASDVNDLLEGFDGVLKDWLDRLHNTKSSLHVVNLWLHALDSFHLSGDLNKRLSIVKSLQDSGGQGFLDVLDGGGLGNGSVSISSGLGSLCGRESVSKLGEELIIELNINGITDFIDA